MITVTQQESHGTTGREEATSGSLCLVCLLGYKGGGGTKYGGTTQQCEQVLSLNFVTIKKLVAESSWQTRDRHSK